MDGVMNAVAECTAMVDDLHDQRLNLAISAKLLEKIDDWRRLQPLIPTRSQAARLLIEMSLERTLGGTTKKKDS